MTKPAFCTIQLLNKLYKIKCPEEEMDNLNLAAQKLNGHLLMKKSKSATMDEQQSILMAALHISHELIVCQQQQAQQRQQLTQFIHALECSKIPEKA